MGRLALGFESLLKITNFKHILAQGGQNGYHADWQYRLYQPKHAFKLANASSAVKRSKRPNCDKHTGI